MKFNLIKDVDELCVQGWVIQQDNLVLDHKIGFVRRDIVLSAAWKVQASRGIRGSGEIRFYGYANKSVI